MTRVFSLILITLLLATLFTALLYSFLTRNMFTQIKTAELLPKARALGALLVQYESRDSDGTAPLLESIAENDALLGASFIAADSAGRVIARSPDISVEDLGGLKQMVESTLRGDEVTAIFSTSISRLDMVSVSVPILKGGRIIGAILLFVPLIEVLTSVSSMNSSLMLSLLIVLPIIMLLTGLMVGRIVRPLKQMRDVAMSMAGGNFQAHADDEQGGEIGQLGHSLNYLAQELSRHISELTLERNRLAQSVDGLQEGFISVDTLGHVTHVNPAVHDLFPASLSADPANHLSIIPYPEVWERFSQAVTYNQPSTGDLSVGERIIRITITPLLSGEGKNAGAVGLFSDITESERLERTRRDYVANVSHELRTPLTAMRALVEPMRDGMVRSEEMRQRYYDILLRETMRLSRLIDDLMELSRLQSGNISMDEEQIDLRELIADIAEKYRAAAKEQNLSFTLEDGTDNCPCVMANPDRVEQILVILLDNAMKYTPEGGSLRLGAQWDEEKVTLSVQDSGVGISPDDLPYVFDRFYKVDKSHSGRGSGLGLSIAREILARMGGRIWVESTVGKGSCFYFTLRRWEQLAQSARQSDIAPTV